MESAQHVRRVLAVTSMLAAAISTAAVGDVIHVKSGAAGAQNGSSWADAFSSLQPALAAAELGDQLWVAMGTYTPAPPAGSRTLSFTLKPGVALYGGFAGDELELRQRDWVTNPTVLSGDLNANDGPPPAPGEPFLNNAENSLHVLVADTAGTPAVIDGFTIAGGNANVATHLFGGGLRVQRPASIEIRNCTFTGNRAQLGGGAIAFFGAVNPPALPNATAVLIDCVFSRNVAGSNGGAIDIPGDGEELFHANRCKFIENSTTDSDVVGGGAIHVDFTSQSKIVEACKFIGNQSQFGAATAVYSASLNVKNCLITANHCRDGGHAVMLNFGPVTVTNCTIVNNTAEGGTSAGLAHGGTIANSIIRNNDGEQLTNADTAVVQYCNVQGGWRGEGNIDVDPLFTGGDFHLNSNSPCIDAGSNAFMIPGTVDLDGNPRIVDGDEDGVAVADIGAYEYQLPPPVPGDIAPPGGNGIVDVDDLLAIINAWGPCIDPDNCHADIAPRGGNGDVNVDDLLMVINNWS